MATAVQADAITPKATDAGDRLLPASIVGAFFLLVGIVAVGFGVPKALASVLPAGGLATTFFRIVIQVGAFAGLIYAGTKLLGTNPPRGLRGGIFLVLATVIAAFLIWRLVGLNFTSQVGKIVAIAITVGLLFGVFKFLTSPRFRNWSIALEDMGWFHTFSYKRTQGLKMRRYTIVGILLVGLSGVWTLMSQDYLAPGDLKIRIPFLDEPVAILADQKYAVPLLLTAAILWLAWRAVNMPTFADFLIATEAEMNKVSWTPRRRLFQDTLVVLITTLLLTAFLLVIDIFWGWLLSLSFIGVLPNKDDLQKLKTTESVTKQAPWEPSPKE